MTKTHVQKLYHTYQLKYSKEYIQIANKHNIVRPKRKKNNRVNKTETLD